MDDGRLYGRGLAFPPRVGPDGRIAFSSGAENIRESIRIILMTEPGERLMLPAFGGGLRSFLYEPNTVTTRRLIQEQIRRSLTRWEPRIRLQGIEVEEDPDNPEAAIATIRYELVATGIADQAQLVLPLKPAGER